MTFLFGVDQTVAGVHILCGDWIESNGISSTTEAVKEKCDDIEKERESEREGKKISGKNKYVLCDNR